MCNLVKIPFSSGAIEFVRSSYAASESNGLIQICVNERRPLLPPTLLYNIQTANGTAEGEVKPCTQASIFSQSGRKWAWVQG